MKTNKMISTLALTATTIAALVFMAVPASADTDDAGLQVRLEKLSMALEKKRKEMHIPGMAIAVVKDDKVIFARGYGVSDIENKTPVTPKTLFAIGSSSKAFTSTLIGMLVDDGKMQWDDPITQYLPYFKFSLENESDKITLRDMLSHRSGFSRNDILWANGKVDRNEILHNAIHAEPGSGFRKKFNYNNVMFLGAGVASARSAATEWDTLLEQRLLKQLGMNKTTSYNQKAKQDPKLSLGYTWREGAGKYQQLPMRNLNNIAPAGGINSNVMDMTHWLRLQLGMGVYEGRRLISEQKLMETRKSQIKIADGVSYGLGWFLREWRGQTVVEHGGNIDGFGAQVAFLPESSLGFVLLTNVTSTPLQQASMNMVWEHLLGESEPKPRLQTENITPLYDEYIGEYIANFGPFRDATFSVLLKDGKLAVDVPGQTVYELKTPDSKDKWYFALTDTVAISFEKDLKGNVSGMRMHQSGVDFELPRKGVPIVAEIHPDELQAYFGQYQSKMFKGNVNVIIQNHRLALDIPNEMVMELQLPDADGHRRFRIRPDMSVVFETNGQGQVTAFSTYRAGKKKDTALRIDAVLSDLPTLTELMDLRQTKQRKIALQQSGGIRLAGKVTMLQAGVAGKVVTNFQGKDQFHQILDFGKYGFMRTAAHASGAATDGIEPFREYHGKYLEQVQKDHPAVDVDWQDFYDSVKIVRASTLHDKKGYIVRLKGGKTPSVTLFVDAETGDVLQRKSRLLIPEMGSLPYTINYEDYRESHGLRFPYKITVRHKMIGSMVIEYETVEAGLNFKPEFFVLKNIK